jgi:hypothetical protein
MRFENESVLAGWICTAVDIFVVCNLNMLPMSAPCAVTAVFVLFVVIESTRVVR